MQIVSQSVVFSHSIPSCRTYSQKLLAAPPVRLALPAPRIAGLLAAYVDPVEDQIDRLERAMGPIRTREEMDAEIAVYAQHALDRLVALAIKYGKPVPAWAMPQTAVSQ